ncbi:hypothetical protein FOCC_FOCC005264 [Frankliniella occidentalis]|nr:hypothetical protein FOCC_FOCC005264 [Frankliniella occidentalis]
MEQYQDMDENAFNPSPSGSDGYVGNAPPSGDVTPVVAARRTVGTVVGTGSNSQQLAGNLKPAAAGAGSTPEHPGREEKMLQSEANRGEFKNGVVDRTDGTVQEMVQNGHAVAGPKRPAACGHVNGCTDVFLCTCCYEPADLEKIMSINWDNPITISAPDSCFPIKVKINGRNLIGLIDENAECSVITPFPWLKDERVQIMRGEIEVENKTVPIEGIFNPIIQLSTQIQTSIPVIVGELPDKISLVLGKNFLSKLQSSYANGSDTYSFKLDGYLTVKGRAKLHKEDEWEILKVSEGNVGKLFKIQVSVDKLILPAVLDLGAVRSVLNTKYCTDRENLQPIKIKLRTANDSFLPVDGVYKPVIKIGNGSVQHPLKYKANISWEDEIITLKINGKIIKTERIKGKGEGSGETFKCNEGINCVNSGSENEENAILWCAESVTIPPNHCEMVKGKFEKSILPAIFSPSMVDENMEVSSMECLLLDETSVPVFNCSNEVVVLSPGTPLGFVRPEDQKIEVSRLTETNMAELRYAVKNNLIRLDGEENLPAESCNVLGEERSESIPSLDGADLTESQKERVRVLCRLFPEVFSTEMKARAPVPNFLTHLERTHQGTIFRRQWPLSARQKEIARKEISKFLDLGVVEDGESIVTLPFFVIEKRGSTAENPVGRCLFDSRALNKVLVKPQYRSYTIADILSYCADKNLLCTLDINHYFFNIAVTEESKLLLGFTFEGRSLRWTRLPQGLAVSPPESLIALSRIMRGLEIRFYVDDLILGSKDFESLFLLLEKVLIRLRDANLCVDPKKATLFRKELPIVGLIVKAGECVRPNPERFKPLLALQNPKNTAQLKSVIAFFSYHRRYLRNFAVKTQKYQDMCNEKIPFEWTKEDAREIENMYQYLLSNATLALFNEDLPTKLHCDASSKSLGAMLCQKYGDRYKPVAYFSAPIKGTKLAWSAFHKECLALYESVKYFEDELRLLPKFTVVSDCTSLKYLVNMESPKAPFDKMISFLSPFSFDFEFVKSEKNKVPDALSRLDPPTESDKVIQLPDSLVTKFNDSLVSPVREMEKVRVESNQPVIKVKTHKVPMFCLPEDGDDANVINSLSDKIDFSPITSFRGKYDFLSNFYPVKIFYNGRDWPSVEHAYQAAKTLNSHEKDEIRNAETAIEAKRLGRLVSLREDWDEVKVNIMLHLLTNKFVRGSDEEKKLLETGERELIEENTWHDDFWGVCVCFKHQGKFGQNVLGQLLCILRNFKRDCDYLNPNLEDRRNMVLAVTRSKAIGSGNDTASKCVQPVEMQNIDPSESQPKSSRSDHQDGAAGDQSGGSGEGTVTSQAVHRSEDEKSDGRLITAEASKQAEAQELGWREKDLLNSGTTIKNFSDDYYFLSIYSPSPFSVNGRKYLSVQDALDSNGFHFSKGELTYVSNQNTDNSAIEKIRRNLKRAAMETAVEFLKSCLAAKFGENSELKQKLIETKGSLLIYQNKCCQNVLGVCACTCCNEDKDVQPLNLLGVELMRLRTQYCRELELLNKSKIVSYKYKEPTVGIAVPVGSSGAQAIPYYNRPFGSRHNVFSYT